MSADNQLEPNASLSTNHSDSTPLNQKEYATESYNGSGEPQAFTGDVLEKSAVDGEPVPEGGDELSQYESEYEASRTLSRRITGADQLIERANATDEPLPTMGGDKPFPPALPDRAPYAVSFDGPDDPTHPQNYSPFRKALYTFCVAYNALCLTVGSAMFSQAAPAIEKIFHIGPATATLGTSLYVMGFASGPIMFGPLSELYGRKSPLLVGAVGFTLFSFAVATAKDIQTIMICRFFTGFIGSAPLVVAPAVMADLYSTKARGKAISIFAMMVFGGPMLAPIMGAFTAKNESLGWRWNSYFCGIIGAAAILMNIFVLPETHHQLILVKKAEILRRRTGNWGIFAPHEELSMSMKEIVENNISRPIIMLATEPILLFVSIYNAFIYGMLYLFLTAIPMVFAGKYHFAVGVAELPYLSMLIGILIGVAVIIYFEHRYSLAMDANNGKPVPEERLIPMMIGGVFFTIGLFWFGWTGNYAQHIHWIVPTIGVAFIGFGLILVFLPCLTYIIDCYLALAASALAGNTFIRSAFAAAFPLFARQMFTAMHINWGSLLVGLVSLVLIPVPFLFYRYGKAFRERSKYAFVL
ncbi:putative transporter [Suhomyces tanzawaensis NRRL Y-17324]|uniref:Putative transporter n=1 Tax=Suhomyces tanzawaensis NRRL Y-17324 TaxID=984487 RepID=A0A1E4SRC1_9ASCO|nr:putative transporter [Suhomyces tanzawaensis NRRL Y-17324]ODV82059.1 putative transporter [Suhomyces tanzawaensis NRRL Y-17324]